MRYVECTKEVIFSMILCAVIGALLGAAIVNTYYARNIGDVCSQAKKDGRLSPVRPVKELRR